MGNRDREGEVSDLVLLPKRRAVNNRLDSDHSLPCTELI